jgi:hypothetical protein
MLLQPPPPQGVHVIPGLGAEQQTVLPVPLVPLQLSLAPTIIEEEDFRQTVELLQPNHTIYINNLNERVKLEEMKQ